MTESKPCIGVLALQGAFQEHRAILERLGVDTVEVRLPDDLDKGLDALVIPGGESTAMAIVGERHGIFSKLKEFVVSGKPVWGTCAGMILLSDKAMMQKDGGQPLIGGLDVEVCRNFFGSQVSSFEVALELEGDAAQAHHGPSSAVFIRAPAILKAGPQVQVLARVHATPCAAAKQCLQQLVSGSEAAETALKNGDRMEVIVAVRQGNILATAFHPELTDERWWHSFFVDIVAATKEKR